ncbi:BspA family leucine-rich repeat surface protein [Lactobacillus kullabergensis]|nr:BspA family leucine-rich repeat surface protein [Lactobacillus kullabergensis]
MNTHKNANKQGEKILLGGIAAAALGLINAKPQTVKAANQNGNRATKKAASRAVKTKLTYQNETGSETEGETATNDDPAGQNSSSQTADSETNAGGTASSNLETGQDNYSLANKSNQNTTIDNAKADKQEIDNVQFDSVNASRESNSSVSSIWNNIPVTFNNGILSLGEKDKTYTIDNSANNNISISQNISNITPDDITEIDINAPITIKGSASQLFYKLSNLNVIKNLNNLVTNDVTDMSFMFANCLKLATLDLSTFDTTNVSNFNGMFGGDTDLSSINLSSFKITDNSKMNTMFRFCSNLKKLVLGSGFKIPEIKGKPDSFLPDLGTWVNMGVDQGSPAKGTNKWSSADLMTKYQGSTDHDTYVCFANLGGTVTVHRQDEEGKQLVDQNGKEIPDEKLFGNISDSVTVDTSKEIAGYTFKENKNSDVKAFISDPQDITLVYSKSKTDNTTISSTWDDIPVTFNNGVLSIGEKGKTYTIDNTAGNEIGINNNISTINTDNITEIDILGKITINGPADSLFDTLPNLIQINGLNSLITSDVTDMSYMFANCPKLVSLDLSSFDTSKVTFFSSMFYADTNLSSINLSNFTITDDAILDGLFDSCANIAKLVLGKGVKFPLDGEQPEDLLKQSGTWVNMGEDDGSLTKGTNQWSSADLITKYKGDRDHDTYVRYTGGIVTVHRQDEEGKQLVDQNGKEIPDEKLFGNISDSVSVDTSKEIAGYTFKENKNSDVKAFISDPQDITLVYSKSKTDNTTISSTWEDIPVTFNNGVLSIGEKGKTYTINNSDNKDISIGSNIDNVSGTDITEIDINAPIAIIGSAETLFYHLLNLTSINGLDKLDTSKVTSMLQMFMDCTKMTSLDLSSFNTTNVTNFSTMFAFDPSLTSVDLSSFTVRDGATTMGMFVISDDDTPSLSKLILGKGFKFTTRNGRPNNSLQQPGTWVNMGEGDGSLTKGTNQWSSADFMTKYQGDRDHDTYVRYTGGTVTVHRQDEEGKQLVDQNGKQIPDEKLFGNISDPVSVDTSKEFAGYTFKENQNPTITAFISDPQTITLVYSKSKTDNTWEGVPYTFNNGVLSLGEKGKTYTINNSDNKDISISQNIKGVNVDEIKEIDLNAPIAISGSAQRLFSKLSNLVSIKGLKNLNTSQVTDMTKMFFGCTKIVSLDLSSFDTTNVTSFNTMFASDPSLTSIDLSSFTVADDATTMGMFVISEDYTPSLSKLILGKGFKFTTSNGRPNNSLNLPGTWVNMGEGNGSLTKGTNQWSSADLMTDYQGDRDHDTYVRYTGGIVTVHRQDEDGKQLVDQDGKEIPDEKLFGNISDPVTVDTSKEFAGYTFTENQNSDITAFKSDPQTITLVYSKSKTDNTSDNTWEGVPYTFNNGVLSLGEKGKNYKIENSGNKEKSYALDTRDISICQTIKGINIDEIKEIDLNANIAIIGSANGLFKNLKNLATIKGLSNLDTSQVTNMEQMFSNCLKLTALDLSSLNTDNVTSYSSMFSGDITLTSVDLSGFKVAANAQMTDMFSACSSLTKLTLGKDFMFTTPDNQPNNSLQQSGTWVNMGEGNGSLTKGANHWSSADFMTKYQGDRDHDTYVRYTGGTVTVHRQDENDNQLVPDEYLFGNISDPVTVDTSKEFAGYKFKENKNSDIKAFISDPQDITLVYTKNSTTPPTPVKAKPVTVYYKYKADNGELVEIPGTNPENFPKDTTTSVVGDHVPISFKSIEGYTPNSYQINNDNIVKSTNLPEVALAADPQSVTLIYTKSDNNNGSNTVNTGTTVTSPAAIAPAVTVHYQDEYGNTIAPDRVVQGRIGDGYTTGAETVSGYALKTRPDNATGFFNNSPQSVTYVYSKSAGNTTNPTPADNTTTAENEPTPIPTHKTKKSKAVKHHQTANKGLKERHQAKRQTKLAETNGNLNKAANDPQKVTQGNTTLPQTGTEKRSSLAMLALGSLALATALGAAWLNRKKN